MLNQLSHVAYRSISIFYSMIVRILMQGDCFTAVTIEYKYTNLKKYLYRSIKLLTRSKYVCNFFERTNPVYRQLHSSIRVYFFFSQVESIIGVFAFRVSPPASCHHLFSYLILCFHNFFDNLFIILDKNYYFKIIFKKKWSK